MTLVEWAQNRHLERFIFKTMNVQCATTRKIYTTTQRSTSVDTPHLAPSEPNCACSDSRARAWRVRVVLLQWQVHSGTSSSTISICNRMPVCALLLGPAMVALARYTKYWRSVSMMPLNPATMSLYSRAPVTTIREDCSGIIQRGQCV